MQFEPVGLEPQGPDKKRLFLAVTMMMFMWFGYVEWITQNAPPPQAPTTAPTKTAEQAAALDARLTPVLYRAGSAERFQRQILTRRTFDCPLRKTGFGSTAASSGAS